MKKAFTLIELLVVVLIIGILAAIALPKYEKAVEKARASEALLNLKHIQQALELKYLEDPNYRDIMEDGNLTYSDIVGLSGGIWNSNGYAYCTEHFYYIFETPDIGAYRSNTIDADCSGYSDVLYSIYIQVPPETGWESYKNCLAATDAGYSLCKGLEGQGFTTVDERE